MVVAGDGCQVPLEDGWQEMKVGPVAPLGPARRPEARSGRTFLAGGPSVCCAGRESAEEFWYRVYVPASQGGRSQQPRRVVVLGAGAAWIWKRAAHVVGGPGVEVVEMVDIYHAYEHLWAVGRALWDTPEAVSAWVSAWGEPLTDARSTQGAPAVLYPGRARRAGRPRRARPPRCCGPGGGDDARLLCGQCGAPGLSALCRAAAAEWLGRSGESVPELDRGAPQARGHALDAGRGAGYRHPAGLVLVPRGRWGGLLGQPPLADAAAAVPAGPSAAAPRSRPAPSSGPIPGASSRDGPGAARAAPTSGWRTPGCAPAPSGRDAPRAPCAAWTGPLCVSLSQSWGTPSAPTVCELSA